MRRAVRKDIWCVCRIVTENAVLREAVIVDISKTGAHVRFHQRGLLPPMVRIKAGRIGLNRMARVAWQSMTDAGLEFVANADMKSVQKPAPKQGQKPIFGKR